LVVLMASCGGVEAQEAEPPVAESSAAVVRPEALGRAMDDVFQQADFTWRFPRDLMQEEEAERGFWGGLVSGLREALDGGLSRLRKWGRSLLDLMGKIVEWIRERLFPAERARPRPGEGMGLWVTVLPWLLLLLLLGMAAVAGVMAWRYGRRKWARVEVAVEVAAAPDLHDERTLADELPEEEWLRLARELAARGDLRLALRAWYLGALAHLAQRGLVTIARHKANRDYLHELERRGRAVPEAAAVFGGLVAVFDRVWYGRHLVDDGVLEAFRGEVERIRAC
jgi:hypothetical protein